MCVGCEEAPGTHVVKGLGRVCDSCVEVVDIVFDVEIERVEAACAQVEAFIATTLQRFKEKHARG
jgi:hypothetical protein